MRKSKKQKEQDLMKLHTLVMKKLDEAMMSVETSKQWKKVKADYGFTMVILMRSHYGYLLALYNFKLRTN